MVWFALPYPRGTVYSRFPPIPAVASASCILSQLNYSHPTSGKLLILKGSEPGQSISSSSGTDRAHVPGSPRLACYPARLMS